ncbi:glutaminase A [Aquipuribacter hungaricus]|uniref:Glutaminase n=1 Tax=Aquipuribacter hungaricus TaxID=545624 RepID=A0ABV7WLH9_9MICO
MARRTPQPPTHPLQTRLEAVHAELSGLDGGTVSTSAPALAEADPDGFGLALCTADGRVHAVGDADREFTVQSAVKPFVYALALADSGWDEVVAHVGVEPTGEPFNALVLEAETGRAPNPMVNAGAIVTCCLVAGGTAREREDRIRAGLSGFAGRPLGDDAQVREAEAAGARNRALAWLMKDGGSLPHDVDDAVDVYLFACSLLVTARDLAVMGATLAAGGRNPLTGEQVVPVDLVPTVLSVMGTCGMYDGAGSWFVKVGLPAKSGVAGGVVAVQPGQLGIGTWSPALDEDGNSVRGIAACTRLSEDLGMHEFRPEGLGLPPVERAEARDTRSRTSRPQEDEDVLRSHEDRLHLVRVQGPLGLRSVDTVCAELLEAAQGWQGRHWLTVDLRAVGWVHGPAVDMLAEVLDVLAASDVTVALVDRDRSQRADWEGTTPDGTVRDLEDALRGAEDGLLASLR